MRRRPGTLHYLTQAIRNESDLHSLAVPVKYRRLGDFHRYYSGEKVAPILTLVIGGNHEASNYFWELYVVPLNTDIMAAGSRPTFTTLALQVASRSVA